MHIVLTGGVASGKSAVSTYFEELGIPIIDADVVSREVVTKGSSGLEAITQRFGSKVLSDDGSLDRASLRAIVFNDTNHLNWLNELLHPMIRQKMELLRKEAERLNQLYSISAIPLFYETIHATEEAKNYSRVLVVDTPEALQLERLMSRDGSSKQEAEALIASQATRQQRLSIADDIVVNDSDLQSLKQQVIKLDTYYRDLARK